MNETKEVKPLTLEELAAVRNEADRFATLERGVTRDPRTGRIVSSVDMNANDVSAQVRFELKSEFSVAKTALARREGNMEDQYEDIEWIYIDIPNKRDNVNRPVTDFDIWRFPVEYAAFKQGKDSPVMGTPLVTWKSLKPADVAELNKHGVTTIEQLANLSDGNAGSIRGFQALKAKAKVYLEQLNKESTTSELDVLKQQIAELTKLITAKSKTSDK